jgi:alpha-acetolactate decarboxylase
MQENIIKKGAANWFHGFGSKGGHLILTDKTLYFEGHKVNVGQKEYEVELSNITSVSTGFPNNLIVKTTSGTEKFVVNGKKEWVALIEKQMVMVD